MTKNIITVQNLTKKFKDFLAVDHISFEVKEGEIFAFLGPNGAGKTTTIKMLTTL
ncbi:MAG: ATP-binding cassette domain-containing protein, partial [Candidatus Shapirobacteria bacterium]|nr:ATP-binding cassette domain-containing protein [Candidatus Shapirobacteria bacterium]